MGIEENSNVFIVNSPFQLCFTCMSNAYLLSSITNFHSNDEIENVVLKYSKIKCFEIDLTKTNHLKYYKLDINSF